MMLVAQFYICWLVFIYTKISAAVVYDIDSNAEYGLVKGLAQMNDTADFRFSKFLDIRLDVDNQSPFDTGDMLLPRTDKNSKGTQNHDKFSKNVDHQDGLDADNNYNKYLLKNLDFLTNQVHNVTKMLTEINGEMAGIKKNISYLSENQMRIHEDTQNGQFSIPTTSSGVTYDGFYTRIQPGRTKDNQTVNIPRDCKDLKDKGNNVSGVYEIQPKLSPKPFLVLCDMETRGGGWTYIQKRFDGSQDFYVGWTEYKFGFGDLDGEFWLGLEKIHFLTSAGAELHIDMVDIGRITVYAHYRNFKIGSESNGYPLIDLTDFSGDAGDSLSYHIGQKFSTKDNDQDENHSGNCAENIMGGGGWWYKSCYHSNLNGIYSYMKISQKNASSPIWNTHYSLDGYSITKTRMLVRQTTVD